MSAGPTLFKRGKWWHYRFWLGGKLFQRSTHKTIRKDARAVAMEAWERAQLASRGMEPQGTFYRLGEEWLECNERVKSHAYVEAFRRFVACELGPLRDVLVGKATSELVERARSEYVAGGHMASSANTWLARVKVLSHWAVSRGQIMAVPWRVRKLSYQKPARTILAVERRYEWLALVATACTHEHAILGPVAMMLLMGLRETEALGARYEWLDLGRMEYTPGRTKGREAWPRPIPEDLLPFLPEDRMTKGLIFQRRDGHQVTPSQVYLAMGKANKNASLVGLTPHGLRRTYATLMHDAGVPLDLIRRILGHKSITTTAGYIHSGFERAREAQKYLSEKGRADHYKTAALSAPAPVNPQQESFKE